MFTQKELNLLLQKWFELLKDYEMSVLYNPSKANVFAYALNLMTSSSVPLVEEAKKDLVKYVHRLSRLGVSWKILQMVVL